MADNNEKISYGFADNFGFSSPFGADSIFSQQSRDKDAVRRALRDETAAPQKLSNVEPKFESGFKHETFFDKNDFSQKRNNQANGNGTGQENDNVWRIERTTLAMDVINATGTAIDGSLYSVDDGLSDEILLLFLKQLSAAINKIWSFSDTVNRVWYEFNLIFPNNTQDFAKEDYRIASLWKFENKYAPNEIKYRKIIMDEVSKFQVFRAVRHESGNSWAGTRKQDYKKHLDKCGLSISVAISPKAGHKFAIDWDEPLYNELDQYQKCVLINPKAIIRTFAHELFTHFFDDCHLSLPLTREGKANIAYRYWTIAKEERRKWLKTFAYHLTDEQIKIKTENMNQNELNNWITEAEFEAWIKNFDKNSWSIGNLPANLWNDNYQKIENKYPNILLVRKYVTHTPEDDGSHILEKEYNNIFTLHNLIMPSQNGKTYDEKVWKAFRKACLIYPFLIQLNEDSVEISLEKRRNIVTELKQFFKK